MRIITKQEEEFNTNILDRLTMLEERCFNYETEMKVIKLALVMLSIDVELLDEVIADIEDSLSTNENTL